MNRLLHSEVESRGTSTWPGGNHLTGFQYCRRRLCDLVESMRPWPALPGGAPASDVAPPPRHREPGGGQADRQDVPGGLRSVGTGEGIKTATGRALVLVVVGDLEKVTGRSRRRRARSLARVEGEYLGKE